MSEKNRYMKHLKKAANSNANAILRGTIFRLARQRDILGIIVIAETVALIALCVFFCTHK